MYKWQVFLGGIASATILVAGAAAPALAQTTAGSPLSTTVQSLTGSQVTAQACNLGGLPMAGQVNSAVAGVTGQSCPASGSTQQTSSSTTNAKQTSTNAKQASSSTPADSSTMTGALPGLSAVTSEIPGLSSMSSALPALNTATSGDTADPTWATDPASSPLSSVTGSSLGSDQPGTATGQVQNTLNGITGTLPVSSLTGGLPNLGSVGSTLSGLTGPQS